MKLRYFTYIITFILLSVSASAQEVFFTIKDSDTGLPISDVSFQYGSQQGITDERGVLRYSVEGDQRMLLSHLSYGRWEMAPAELHIAVARGEYRRNWMEHQLQPVAVLAMRVQTRQEVERGLDFSERLAHDAGALLDELGGFSSIRKSGAYGFDPVFRSYKYEQLNLVLDGAQTASAACPNRMDPPASQFTPNMLDRIEVYKGPHALRYGGGLGGTVNFISPQANFRETSRLGGRWSGGYEHNGGVRRTETAVNFGSPRLALELLGAWAEGTDYKDGASNPVPAGFERHSLGARADIKLAELHTLRISANRNVARDVDFPALGMDLRDDDTRMYQVRYEGYFSGEKFKKWDASIYGSRVNHLMDNGMRDINPRMMDAATHAMTDNFGGRTEFTFAHGATKVFLGMDYRYESAAGTREREFLLGPNAGKVLFDSPWQDASMHRLGGFVELHSYLKEIHWVAAARFNYTEAGLASPAPEFTAHNDIPSKGRLSPSLSLGAVKSLGQHFTVGAWIARAERAAGITERFINHFAIGNDPYELLGNPGLRPERLHQLDLNLSWKQGKHQLSLDIFGGLLADYISGVIDTSLSPRLPSSPGVRRFENLDAAVKTGFEFAYKQRLSPRLRQELFAHYTYAAELENHNALPEIPPFELRHKLQLQAFKNRLHASSQLRWAAPQNRISREFGESRTPGFLVLDLHLLYALTPQVQLALAALNLTDSHYYEHLNRSIASTQSRIYAPGRSFNIAVNVRINQGH